MSDINYASDFPSAPEERPSVSPEMYPEDLRRKISERAYALFEKRGCEAGFELLDWLQAEREVLAQEGIH